MEAFYRARIATAKVIQYRYLADRALATKVPDGEPADFSTEKRPALIELGDEIMQTLREFLENGERCGDEHLREFQRIVDVEKLDEADEIAVCNSVRSICLAQ